MIDNNLGKIKPKLLAMLLMIFFALVGSYFIDSNLWTTHILLQPRNKQCAKDYMLSSLNVTAISQDSRKLIWIGTSAGINVYNGSDYIQFFHDVNDTTALPDDYINVLHRDRSQRMWVGTQNGLAMYVGGTCFRRFTLPDTNENIVSISDAKQGDGVIVSNGKHWFEVSAHGVRKLHDATLCHTAQFVDAKSCVDSTLRQYGIMDASKILQKPKELISTAFRDAGGNLWVGYRNAGYQVISANVVMYSKANENPLAKATKGLDVTCLQTVGDNILAGTTLRLIVYDTQNHQISQKFYTEIFDNTHPDKQGLVCIVPLSQNSVCLVGNNELVFANLYGGNLNITNRISALPLLGASDKVGSYIYSSSQQPFLIRYNINTQKADSVKVNSPYYDEETQPLALQDGNLLLFLKDMHFALVDAKTHIVKELKVKLQGAMHNIDPAFARQDAHGIIWLGTKRSGLYKLDMANKTIERTNFVSDVHIQALKEDRVGQIWITTLKDATCYQPNSGEVLMNSLVSSSQNEWNKQYFDNAIALAPDGKVVLGSSDGCIFLPPSSGDKNLIANKLSVEGRSYSHDNKTSLEKGLCIYNVDIKTSAGKQFTINDYDSFDNLGDGSKTKSEKHYTLWHDENNLSLSFYYPNFSKRSSMRYQYMLEGYDKQWREPTFEHEAVFSNLPPGNYTFRLRLVSSPSLPAMAERSFMFTVKPALWDSAAAWYTYAVIVMLLVYYINTLYLRIRTNRLLLSNEQREREREQRTNEMNMSFFANISHEFRNPITIIAGPLLALKSDVSLPKSVHSSLNRVCISVNRMLRLIDQMLDFNQLETDALRLKVAEQDCAELLQTLISSFEESAQIRNIKLIAQIPSEPIMAWIDADKLEKILSNLFTNALKHTPENGSIEITAAEDRDAGKLTIVVYNSDSHIEEDKLQDVFKRYYQLTDTQSEHQYGWGTGIGLYYVKRLAELHHGSISVCNVRQGVEFRLSIPIGKASYLATEQSDDRAEVMQIPVDAYPMVEQRNMVDQKPTTKILIVDDDIDVAQYIRSIFANDYIVENRYSAEEALADMESIAPDIILSDIIMGDMSGYDFCKTLKSDLMYSHIPVVLITAKSNIDEQIAGLRLGAVAYVTKPFDPFYLKAIVETQLANIRTLRQRLGENTETGALAESVADSLSEQDRKFMDELYALMEKRAAEQELNVATISRDLLISQSKFTYKLKELTGDTPGTFFRKYKLNKAAQLLKEGKYNVSEIAIIIGFGTAAHFSVAFKKQFGVSPSEYH